MGELRNVLGGNAAMTLRIRQPGWQAALLAADYSKVESVRVNCLSHTAGSVEMELPS